MHTDGNSSMGRIRRERTSRSKLIPATGDTPDGLFKPQKRFRRFTFTINNYADWELAAIKTIECTWLIVGREKAASGTPHLQGACILGSQEYLNTIKLLPGMRRAHIEPMRGTPEQNYLYCTKEDHYAFEKGERPKVGKRNDLINVCEKIKNGQTISEILYDDDMKDAATFVKYHKGLTLYRSVVCGTRSEPPIVIWIHGSTGVGKTRFVHDFVSRHGQISQLWVSNNTMQWFDGYTGQPYALFDDFRTSQITFSFLLRVLDRYPLQVPIKGGFVQWIPRWIFVTSPQSPESTYNLRRTEDIQQLVRRVSRILDFDRPFDQYEYGTRINEFYDGLVTLGSPITVEQSSSSSSSMEEEQKESSCTLGTQEAPYLISSDDEDTIILSKSDEDTFPSIED